MPEITREMSKITREQMVEWLEYEKTPYRESAYYNQYAMIDAVIAALEPKKIMREDVRSLIDTLDFLRAEAAQYRMETVDDLPSEYLKNIKKIEDCILLAALDGPGEEERKEMWHWVESWRNLCRDGMVHGCDKCKLTENGQLSKPKCDEYRDKIRDIIMGKGAADASKVG